MPVSGMYMYMYILVTWQHGNTILQLILMQATLKASYPDTKLKQQNVHTHGELGMSTNFTTRKNCAHTQY